MCLSPLSIPTVRQGHARSTAVDDVWHQHRCLATAAKLPSQLHSGRLLCQHYCRCHRSDTTSADCPSHPDIVTSPQPALPTKPIISACRSWQCSAPEQLCGSQDWCYVSGGRMCWCGSPCAACITLSRCVHVGAWCISVNGSRTDTMYLAHRQDQ